MLGGNRLWRHADFLKLWTGQTISVVGSEVTAIALPTIAILQLHASAAQVGLLAAAQQIAFPVLALFAGVLADRLRRRPMMILADGVRALAILSVPIAAAFGVLSLVQLYVVALVLGVGTVLFDIAYLAYVPSLVSRDDLLEANTKLEVSFSGSHLVGPSLGGVLIQVIGAAQAMVADALSFVASVVSIIWIRQPEEPPRHPTAPRAGVLAEIGEGLRLVLHNPILRALLLMLTIGGIGFHLQDPALFLFVYRNVHLSPGLVGLVFWRWRGRGSGRGLGGWNCRAQAWCRQFPGPHQRAPRAGLSGLAAGAFRVTGAGPWRVDVFRRHLRLDLQREPGQPPPGGDAEPPAGPNDGHDAHCFSGGSSRSPTWAAD